MAFKGTPERKPSQKPKPPRRSTASRSDNATLDSCPNYMKPTRSFEARSVKLARKAPRLGIAGVSREKVRRSTCASTLKDVSLPPYLPLTRGATESEGPSLFRVCPYSYCSLNGHYHKDLVPLRYFIAERRKLMRSKVGEKGWFRNLVHVENSVDALSEKSGLVDGDEVEELPAKLTGFDSVDELGRSLTNSSLDNDHEEDVEVERLDDLVEDSTPDDYSDAGVTEKRGLENDFDAAEGFLESDFGRDENWKSESGAGVDLENGLAGDERGRSGDFVRSFDAEGDEVEDGRSIDEKQGSECGSSKRMMNYDIKNDSEDSEEGCENGRSSGCEEILTNNAVDEDDEGCESGESNEFAERLASCASENVYEEIGGQGFGSGRSNESKESLGNIRLEYVSEGDERGGRNRLPMETRDDIDQIPGIEALESDEDREIFSINEFEGGERREEFPESEARGSHENGEEFAMNEYVEDKTRDAMNHVFESEAGESDASHRCNEGACEGAAIEIIDLNSTTIDVLKENTTPESTTSLLEGQSDHTCKGTQKKNSHKSQYKRRTWDVAPIESNYLRWGIGCGMPLDTTEETNYSQRDPYFLTLVPDPEGEKVDLKHQEIDDRRNADEWMIDHALQLSVSKLASVKTKKVELIVEAFESVLPEGAAGYSSEGLRHHGQLCN